MIRAFPDWRPVSPGSAASRLEIPVAALGPHGARVAFVCAGGDTLPDWAASTVLEVARAWAGMLPGPIRVVDASLDRGVLAGPAPGRACTEGVTDAVLFGASLDRILREDDQGIEVVSAGTPVGPGWGVLEDEAWARLWDALRAPGGAALCLVTSDQEGVDAVLRRADQVVVLRRQDEPDPTGLTAAAAKVVAVLGPQADEARVRELEPGFDLEPIEPVRPPRQATDPGETPDAGQAPDAEVTPRSDGFEAPRTDLDGLHVDLDEPDLEEPSRERRPEADEAAGREAAELAPMGETAEAAEEGPHPDVDLDLGEGDELDRLVDGVVEATDRPASWWPEPAPVEPTVNWEEGGAELPDFPEPATEPAPESDAPSDPAWTDLGDVFSLREEFRESATGDRPVALPEDDLDRTIEERESPLVGPPGWAGEYEMERVDLTPREDTPAVPPIEGLIGPTVGELRKAGTDGRDDPPAPALPPPPDEPPVRPRPAPRAAPPPPRRTPVLRALLLLLVLVLLFALWRGWFGGSGGEDSSAPEGSVGAAFTYATTTVHS
ncbi:MAG: hypothetical protein R3E98_20970 [Gemmatimonadota bacterium]